MRVLVYGINHAPELTGIGKYSGEMTAWLAQQGHEVTAVTAPPYYPDWQLGKGYSRWRITRALEQGVTVYRCPLYVPRQPSALKRMLHLLSFSLTSMFALLYLLRWRPQLVVYVVPTLFCALQALLYARLTGSRIVLHVQDYEVDAFFGLGMAKAGLLARFAYGCERWLMRRFNRVSTISTGMLRRAHLKGVPKSRLMFFPNWSEVVRFNGVARSSDLLLRLGVNPTHRVVLYAGNMGEKQGLEQVFEAALRLQSESMLTFLMVGEGGDRERLQDLAQGLPNVIFAPLQSYEALPALLASADVHLVVQKRGVADAVLPSKLTNILAVGGNAVVTADADTTLGQLCQDHPGLAVCVEPESVSALAQGIKIALAMPAVNQTAQQYAQQHLDKDAVLSRFICEVMKPTAKDVA